MIKVIASPQNKRRFHGAILAKLAEIVDAGALKPLLDESPFGLEQVGKAHDCLTSGQAMGKLVVEIQGFPDSQQANHYTTLNSVEILVW